MAFDMVSLAVTSLGVFIAAWVLLFVISYIFTPFFMKYGDQRSRALYSAVYSLAFAVIIGIGYGVMPLLSNQIGFLPTLLVAVVFVLLLTVLQNLFLNQLYKRGLLKMQRK